MLEDFEQILVGKLQNTWNLKLSEIILWTNLTKFKFQSIFIVKVVSFRCADNLEKTLYVVLEQIFQFVGGFKRNSVCSTLN